jgi:HipA-like kinase
MPEPRRVTATRYVTPLREGGSLPGLVEADDDGLYVVKFRGAGQGPRALVAEWLAGEIGRALGLPVPDIVTVDVEGSLGDAEPDQELQDLVHRSDGLNLGLDFLPGALAFNPGASPEVDPAAAADVVWLDAFTTNPDRTAGNPNLLVWHGRTWLIDHGAALYIHHTWRDPDEHATRPFERSRDHVLLPFAGPIDDADARLAPILERTVFERLVAAIPDLWLPDDPIIGDADGQRAAYVRYLEFRLAGRQRFVEEAERVRRAA